MTLRFAQYLAELYDNANVVQYGRARRRRPMPENVIVSYVTDFVAHRECAVPEPVTVVTPVKFNPNLTSSWFTSVMQIISTTESSG